MKALLYPAFEQLVLTEQAVPAPAEGEVLLRVAACGICGSELESFRSRSPRRPPPLVMGHEFCGTIEAVGPGVSGFEAGQKVICNALVPCGACVRCLRGDMHLCAHRQIFGMHRSGAFAEFVAAPAHALIPWPDTLPPEMACLAEPLANGVHMVGLTYQLHPQTVLIIGAGPIGLLAQQVFQALTEAAVFTADLSPERLAISRNLGAAKAFDARETDVVAAVRQQTEGEGVDLVIDAVGSALTKQQSLAAARPGGAVVWIGLHENDVALKSYDVTLSEKQILGTYAARKSELETAVRLMEQGRVQADGWVQTFPLESGVEAFHRMLAAQGNDIKAVLTP